MGYNIVRFSPKRTKNQNVWQGGYFKVKKILFVASEAVPFIKTGGLADVVGALPKCFDKNYFDVRVIIPKYLCMKEEYKNQLQYITHFYMDIGYRREYVGIMKMEYDGIKFYFIDN